MSIQAIDPKKFKEQFLEIDTESKPCPWPAEATLLLSFFFNAVRVDDLSLGYLGDGYLTSEEIRASLGKLQAKGILTNLEAPSALPDHPAGTKETGICIALLTSMLHLLYSAVNDVGALGHAPVNADATLQRSLQDELKELHTKVETLAKNLMASREPHLKQQLAKLKLQRGAKGLKLHFGVPGLRKLDGWINIEGASGEFACSLTWPMPFDAGAVDRIYSAHTLEHLFYKTEALFFLKEMHRVLKSGGAMRIVTPDIQLLIDAYSSQNDELIQFRQNLKHYNFTSMYRSRLEHLMRYSGAGVRPWEPFMHKFGYDFETLRNLLNEAGFRQVRHCSFNGSAFEDLRIDHHCSGAQQRHNERYFSLFIEAIKD